MSTMPIAATRRQPTATERDAPLPLWLVTWIGGACVVLILTFDSMVWDRVPVTFAQLAGPGTIELLKAAAALVAALTPLIVGTLTGVAKIVAAWKGKPAPDEPQQ